MKGLSRAEIVIYGVVCVAFLGFGFQHGFIGMVGLILFVGLNALLWRAPWAWKKRR